MSDRGLHWTPERYAQEQKKWEGVNKMSLPEALIAMSDLAALRVPKKPRMNKWETEYAQILEFEQRMQNIIWYKFEPIKLWLGDGAWFTPDFGLLNILGQIEFREVKGFWREAAKVRIKVARSMYPFTFRCMRKVDGAWVEEQL